MMPYTIRGYTLIVRFPYRDFCVIGSGSIENVRRDFIELVQITRAYKISQTHKMPES